MKKIVFNDKPYSNLNLGMNDVHIWHAHTDISEHQLNELFNVLSPEEIDRANRFYFKSDRKQYVVARGILRNVLSYYCDQLPNQHKFVYNHYGKPFLEINNIRFNVSHSQSRILIGFTNEREIGVDIEYIKTFERAEEIVSRYFSDYEKNEFHKLPDFLKNTAFINCWTRKEAYIKACGIGLSMPLDQFSVSFIPGDPARLIDIKNEKREKDRWTLKDLKYDHNYIAATVVKGHDLIFKDWEISWN